MTYNPRRKWIPYSCLVLVSFSAAWSAAQRPPPCTGSTLACSQAAFRARAGVHKLSETSYALARTTLERALVKHAADGRNCSLLPHEEAGKVVGLKVYGIRPGGLLALLGIENGDLLRSINGHGLASAESALAAYNELHRVDRIVIDMARRGVPRIVEIRVE